LLVLVPSSLKLQWKDELLFWINNLRDDNIQIVNSQEDLLYQAKIYIVSYDLASKYHKQITAKKFNACIADEAHYLKNY
jgi:SNF2 family DNA or RNA helicase